MPRLGLGRVVHTCDHNTQGAEAGDLKQPGLRSETPPWHGERVGKVLPCGQFLIIVVSR